MWKRLTKLGKITFCAIMAAVFIGTFYALVNEISIGTIFKFAGLSVSGIILTVVILWMVYDTIIIINRKYKNWKNRHNPLLCLIDPYGEENWDD